MHANSLPWLLIVIMVSGPVFISPLAGAVRSIRSRQLQSANDI